MYQQGRHCRKVYGENQRTSYLLVRDLRSDLQSSSMALLRGLCSGANDGGAQLLQDDDHYSLRGQMQGLRLTIPRIGIAWFE